MAKATENKVIEIKPIKMNRVEVTLVGDTPLIVHAGVFAEIKKTTKGESA